MDIKSIYQEQLGLKENQINKIQEQIIPLKQKMDVLKNEIEALDDPTDDSGVRAKIGDAHYSLEECIDTLKEVAQQTS